MAKKLYRCVNPECAEDESGHELFDFEADEPVCPKCGADARNKKDGGGFIVKRECLHYLVVDKAGLIPTPLGRRLIACMPGETKLVGKFSSHVSGVTCPECKETAVFKQHEEDLVDQTVGFRNPGPRQ